MLSVQDFIKWLKVKGNVTLPVYPNSFPNTAKKECLMLEVNVGFPLKDGLYDTVVSVTARAENHQVAETNANTLKDLLSGLTDEQIGEAQVVKTRANMIIPFYEGEDDNNLKYYRVDFRALVNVG